MNPLPEDLYEIYQEILLQHAQNPLGYGKLPPPALHTESTSTLCGDHIELFALIEGGTITKVKWHGTPHAICTASASLMSKITEGSSTLKALNLAKLVEKNLTDKNVHSLPDDLEPLYLVHERPQRIANALLPWQALVEILQK